MDLSALSTAELRQLQKDIPQLIQQKRVAAVSAAQAAVLKVVEESGLSRQEVLGPLLAAKRLPLKFVKYQNPNNADQVWLGRGKQPNWLRDLVASGRKLEEFIVE